MQEESKPDESTPENQDQKQAEENREQAQAAPSEAANAEQSEEQPATEEAQAPDLEAQLAEAQAKAAENWDHYVRATAEQDNIRKRAEREVEKARSFAVEKFAQGLLPVWDSLELGLKSAKEAGADASILEGTEMTLKLLAEAMQKSGVEQIDPKGEAFNPELHEAMTAVPNPEMEPNTVMDVMQKGYSLNGRLLRPAMVVVTKAP